MRLVLQRVGSAAVTVEGEVISSIGRGLVCYVGIGVDDTPQDALWAAKKLLDIRLWSNEEKNWNLSTKSMGYEVLLVSQFTLFMELKGNKPDFHLAMPPQAAEPVYDSFVEEVRRQYDSSKVKTGVFGAMMDVSSVNLGPVTVNLDSSGKSNNGSRKAKVGTGPNKKKVSNSEPVQDVGASLS